MTPFTAAVLLLSNVGLLVLPRRWAMLAFLAGSCYTAQAEGVDLGVYTFTPSRIMICVGYVRFILRGERLAGELIEMDRWMLMWGAWSCGCSIFFTDPWSHLTESLGLLMEMVGTYFLVRVLTASVNDAVAVCRGAAILILPIVVAMAYETRTGVNLLRDLNGLGYAPYIRDGRLRAMGPFAQPILGGTVGGLTLPLMGALWGVNRMTAILGTAASLGMIFTSASSGPIMTGLSGIVGLALWPLRKQVKLIRRTCLAGLLLLSVVMKDPPYYIIARIDLTGSSSSWHRAALIESSMQHLNEWWFAGTEYTRHWMPTGVTWSANHTDITNHYLKMGVNGGLPLMALFIALFVFGFRYTGKTVDTLWKAGRRKQAFAAWAIGCGLFAHAVTCISVSYWDQTRLYLAFSFALCASVWSCSKGKTKTKRRTEVTEETESDLEMTPIERQDVPAI